MAAYVLVCCVYLLHVVDAQFLSDMEKDKSDMVASLRQAQTPEPQIMAVSKAFDRIASNVSSMSVSFFAFTTVVIVGAYTFRRNDPPREETKKLPHDDLKHEPVN